MQPKLVAIRKRTQIAAANRAMFIWVACASVIVGFAVVGSIFLTQKLLFNDRVIEEKLVTVATLKSNNDNIKELRSQIRVINADQALIDAKSDPKDEAVQVILDALPSDVNILGLGKSLELRILAIPGIIITKLQFDDPVVGVESLSGGASVSNLSSSLTSMNVIPFSIVIQGGETIMKEVLTNMERSIRTIDIIDLKIEGKDTLTIKGRAFYEPVRNVELQNKMVK